MDEIKYRSEEEMKDSGIEWLGKIPKEWKSGRVQHFFITRSEKVSDKVYEPLSVTKSGILKQLKTVAKTDNGDNRKKVLKDDFVINSRADRKGSCGISPYDGSVSLICHVLKPLNKFEPSYVNYLFRNYYFSEEFYRWGTGIVDDLWSTNIDRMRKILIPILELMEQQKIANFLDMKTAQFDSIISKKEELIKKLEEAKKSLISEVVTGKVKIHGDKLVKRDSSEMKDSGVEWLGMIPKDWQVKKIKHIATMRSGNIITNESIKEEGEFPVYGGNGLRGYTHSFTHKGDYVLIGRQGALCGNVNYAHGMFWASEHAVVVSITSKTNYIWLGELLKSMNLNQYSISAAQPGLSVGMISNLYIPYPENYVQENIAIFFNNKTKEYAKTIDMVKRQIEKLKEAKQSLISEAVTGKIDLRDWEPIEEGE
ncbi:MAG: restriction endonuclease subunit S [Anaeromicrobium sp.]|jgi:type I restriction enzyme S subunit|uniref:restriction endonuclease subunit S n=1 Tax=Anaeromicrobium sp. TaxID=1929132 RepID=UPI0025F9B742|nr:restriction endonuclease subunit S [Anaeromicrobium sp.]MCT4595919.1 restriction endonuclease subunit S [Anaeromicrobium sp.]